VVGEIDRAVEILAASGRLPPEAVFVDIGAHIGTHTIYALRTGRFARAVAFEPEPRNARLLAMNLEANDMSRSVVVVTKAAGAAPGTAVLHLHPRNTGAHSIPMPPSIDGQASLQVEIVRADEALSELGIEPNQVGLAWVDVEGYEPCVLHGLGKLIERSVPIAFEFTPRRYDAHWRAEMVALLKRHYTRVHSLGRQEPCAPIEMLKSHKRTDDVLVI
jgi:FkbM family methyltransferase